MLPSTRRASRANGRAATTRSCARRSFDAATIFIAFVICCVDFTARIRRRMSMRDGTDDELLSNFELRSSNFEVPQPLGCGGRDREFLPELFQRLTDLCL